MGSSLQSASGDVQISSYAKVNFEERGVSEREKERGREKEKAQGNRNLIVHLSLNHCSNACMVEFWLAQLLLAQLIQLALTSAKCSNQLVFLL